MLLNLSISPAARRAARHLQTLSLLTMLSIGTAVAASLMLTTPAQEHLARAEADYHAARQMQLRLQVGRQTLEELREVWGLLPPRKDFSSLVLAISELARRDRVEIPGMNYTFQKGEEGLALKATMTFRAAGDYAGIRAFIHRLETTGPYLFIESLDASRSLEKVRASVKAAGPSGSPRERTVVVLNVRVVTFLRPDPSSVNPPPRPTGPPTTGT
jgi:hypothetical protein